MRAILLVAVLLVAIMVALTPAASSSPRTLGVVIVAHEEPFVRINTPSLLPIFFWFF